MTGVRGGVSSAIAAGFAALFVAALLAPTSQAAAAGPVHDLRVEMSDAPDPVSVSSSLTYTLVVSNRAVPAATAEDIGITDILPEGVVFRSATPTKGTCTPPPPGGRVVRCSAASVAPGESYSVAIVVAPTAAAAGRTITNTASVYPEGGTGSSTEVNSADNVAYADTRVRAGGAGQVAVSVEDASIVEGNADTADAVFLVSLDRPATTTVSLAYATADGTADQFDYFATSGTLAFQPGQTRRAVAVEVAGDGDPEADESFFLRLSLPSNAVIDDAEASATIVNDDPVASPDDPFTPRITVDDVRVDEGAAGGQAAAVFTVTLDRPPTGQTNVRYATVDADTTPGSDYTPASGTLAFDDGQTTAQAEVTVLGDGLHENDETFFLHLSDPIGARLADGDGRGTIVDDDAGPSVSVGDASVPEGDVGTTTDAVFSFSLSQAPAAEVSVDYTTVDATAASPADFGAKSGTVRFAAGQTSATATVGVNGDDEIEPDETFFVRLTGSAGASLEDSQGRGTIVNDDGVSGASRVSVDDVEVREGDGGTSTKARFTVAVTPPSDQEVQVSYRADDGVGPTAAVAPGDFAAVSGTVVFAKGQTARTVEVEVRGDDQVEPDEVFRLLLSGVSGGATLEDGEGGGTILNDDPSTQPGRSTVGVSDVAAVEGNEGVTAFVFVVTLTPPREEEVTVDVQTTDGPGLHPATAPADYATRASTLRFPPGAQYRPVIVEVRGERLTEFDETFSLRLTKTSTNAQIVRPEGQGTILNDDAGPSFLIDDVSVAEGPADTTTDAVFTVSLSQPWGADVSVAYATADGTATAPGDYAATAGRLAFPAGTERREVRVVVRGDDDLEPHEAFFVRLSDPQGATIADDEGEGVIMPDGDGPAGLVFLTGHLPDDNTSEHPNTEGARNIIRRAVDYVTPRTDTPRFLVVDVNASQDDVGMSPYQVSGFPRCSGPGPSAPPGCYDRADVPQTTWGQHHDLRTVDFDDYDALVVGWGPCIGKVLTPSEKERERALWNTLISRRADIGAFLNRGGGVTAWAHHGMLYARQEQSVCESDTPAPYAFLPVDLEPRLRAFGDDQTGNTLTPAGRAMGLTEADINPMGFDGYFARAPHGWDVIEYDKQQRILSMATRLPAGAVTDVTVTEGDGEAVSASFTIDVAGSHLLPVTVDYTTQDGSAKAGADYTPTIGSTTFGPGQPGKLSVTVPVLGDTVPEEDERFYLAVTFSEVGAASVGRITAKGRILDDDRPPPNERRGDGDDRSQGGGSGDKQSGSQGNASPPAEVPGAQVLPAPAASPAPAPAVAPGVAAPGVAAASAPAPAVATAAAPSVATSSAASSAQSSAGAHSGAPAQSVAAQAGLMSQRQRQAQVEVTYVETGRPSSDELLAGDYQQRPAAPGPVVVGSGAALATFAMGLAGRRRGRRRAPAPWAVPATVPVAPPRRRRRR